MIPAYTGQPAGGWLTLPAGTFELDPSSDIHRIQTEGISYDRAINRWVPADWNHLSADGRRYAWLSGNGLRVDDARTGAGKAIALPNIDGVWVVVDFNEQGVYLTDIGGLGAPTQLGLWLANPDTGQIRRLDSTQYWSEIDATAAWGVKTGSSDVELMRLDFRTGAVTTELTVPYHHPAQPGDRSLELLALDLQGRPLVLIRDWQKLYPWRLALLTGVGTLGDVTIPDSWAAGWPPADNGDPYQLWRTVRGYRLSQGIWMIGNHSFPGVAFLGSDGIVRQLSAQPEEVSAIAGGCH